MSGLTIWHRLLAGNGCDKPGEKARFGRGLCSTVEYVDGGDWSPKIQEYVVPHSLISLSLFNKNYNRMILEIYRNYVITCLIIKIHNWIYSSCIFKEISNDAEGQPSQGGIIMQFFFSLWTTCNKYNFVYLLFVTVYRWSIHCTPINVSK